jgi:hypothetical protein
MTLTAPVHQLRLDAIDPPADLAGDVYVADRPPPDWDERWARLDAQLDIRPARDTAYLTSRYTDRPDKRYSFLVSPWVDALAVVEMGPHTAHVMELLAPRCDVATIARLALACEFAAARAGAKEIEAWFPESSEVARVLAAACRYRPEAGPRVLNGAGDGDRYYTMGDWHVH